MPPRRAAVVAMGALLVVLTWCAANAVVEMDASGNLKVSRRKSSEKIDGIVALAMAVGRWMAQPADDGFYFAIV